MLPLQPEPQTAGVSFSQQAQILQALKKLQNKDPKELLNICIFFKKAVIWFQFFLLLCIFYSKLN